MWRDDHVYDLVVDIGWNRSPVVRGRGSAIFLHLAKAGFTPTEGCVAVDGRMIGRLLESIGPGTTIEILDGTSRLSPSPRASRPRRMPQAPQSPASSSPR